MHGKPLFIFLIALVALQPSTAQTPDGKEVPRSTPACPIYVGDGVNPQNHAHWPARIRRLDRVAWRFSGGDHVGMAIPGPGDRVYVQANWGGIHAVDSRTGKHRWKAGGNRHFPNYSTCVRGPKGNLYGGNYDSLACVDAKGNVRWTTQLDAGRIHRPPAISPDGSRIYVGGENLGIASLDAVRGEVKWAHRDFLSPFTSYAFDPSGQLIVSFGSRVVCFDHAGETRWELASPMKRIMVADDALDDVLIGFSGTVLRAFSLSKPERLWEIDLQSKINGMALGRDRRVIVALESGELAEVPIRHERQGPGFRELVDVNSQIPWDWRQKISSSPLFRPATGLEDEMLVMDRKGWLYLLSAWGQVLSSLNTGGPPWRWRPTVGPDGRVYVSQKNQLLCIDGGIRKTIRKERYGIWRDGDIADVWLSQQALDSDLRELKNEKGIVGLRFAIHFHQAPGPFITDAGLAQIRGWADLRVLQIPNSKISDRGLRNLSGLRKLETLDLSFTNVGNAGMAHIAPLTNLRELWLRGTRVTDAGMVHIARMKRLKVARFFQLRISDWTLEQMQHMRELEDLQIGYALVTDEGLRFVSGMKRLKEIDLQHSLVTDAGLRHLSGLSRLSWLCLNSTAVTSAGMTHLKDLRNLKWLNMEETKITDSGLKYLTGLSHLESLYLTRTALTDEAIDHIVRLKSLTGLNLSETGVTDVGIARLKQLVNLRDLELHKTKVTAKGIRRLRETLPKLKVVADQDY